MKQNSVKTGFFAAVVVLCLLSIALNIFLYSQLRKYYTMLYVVELDPLGLSYFQYEDPPKPDDQLKTVVFYGDSRAAQWPSPAVEGFWFVNRGIGNQTTAQVVSRFEEHIAPLHPEIVILQAGINDLKTIPLFPERKQEIIANCEENILKIIEASRSLNSLVVVSTIFPTGEIPLQRRLVWSDDIDEAVLKVNAYIRSLAGDGVIVFDSAALLADANGKIRQEYRYDALHLNQAGYDALNLEFTKLLSNIQHDLQTQPKQAGQ